MIEHMVFFSLYIKKEGLSKYNCINYGIPTNIFYNILKENKKDYLKLFSIRPEQIKKYLNKIDNVKIEHGYDCSIFLNSLMGRDSLDNEEYFYTISIPYIIKKKYSNTQSGVVIIVTKDKNDKGNKLSYFNISSSYRRGFEFVKKIDPIADSAFMDKTLCKFNLNKEMGDALEIKTGIIRLDHDIPVYNITSGLSYDCNSYKTTITPSNILEHKSIINILNYKDKELVDFIKIIQRDCGEDDINLKFKINLDYYGINSTHVMIQFILSNVNMNNTFENYEYTMSVFKENKSDGVYGYSKCLMNNKKISYKQFINELLDILNS